MNFNWNNYLFFAQDLCGKKAPNSSYTHETRMRCAISRAYYSAFCIARNYIKAKEEDLPDKSDGAAIHGAVKSYFKNNENRTFKQIGINLDRLRISRNKADYEDIYYDSNNKKLSNLTSEAIMSISHSENIISSIRYLVELDNTKKAK